MNSLCIVHAIGTTCLAHCLDKFINVSDIMTFFVYLYFYIAFEGDYRLIASMKYQHTAMTDYSYVTYIENLSKMTFIHISHPHHRNRK